MSYSDSMDGSVQWRSSREDRFKDITECINSNSVWDVSSWDWLGVYHAPYRAARETRVFRCGPMSKDFFHEVVVPCAHKHLNDKYPGSRLRVRNNHFGITQFCGELYVTFQPTYLKSHHDVTNFWLGYGPGLPMDGDATNRWYLHTHPAT